MVLSAEDSVVVLLVGLVRPKSFRENLNICVGRGLRGGDGTHAWDDDSNDSETIGSNFGSLGWKNGGFGAGGRLCDRYRRAGSVVGARTPSTQLERRTIANLGGDSGRGWGQVAWLQRTGE